jgi:hypothetical protein
MFKNNIRVLKVVQLRLEDIYHIYPDAGNKTFMRNVDSVTISPTFVLSGTVTLTAAATSRIRRRL